MNETELGPRSRLSNLSMAIALAFIVVAGALVYWSVIRSEAILAREDNPRLVERELRIQRGSILDAQNSILAETVGPVDDLRRQYPIAAVGPAVGYYSFRHGTAGIEAGYDQALRGQSDDFWQNFWQYEVLHQEQVGRDIRLTLRATWQQVTNTLLGDQNGAVVLLSVPDGQVLAMASHPGYDPNRLDENFETLVNDESAPLLNRATQGQYQPGMAIQPFILAAAVAEQYLELEEVVDQPGRPVSVDGQSTQCAVEPPEPVSWPTVLQLACPSPMQSLAGDFGAAGLQELFTRLGFYSLPPLPIEAETSDTQIVEQPELAIIGQENLTLSPMQLAMALVGLANDGELPQPILVQAVQNEFGEWEAPSNERTDEAFTEPAVPAEAAELIVQSMSQVRGISEHSALALAGPQGTTNAWYLGLAPAGQPRYAVVVIVEEVDDLFSARRIGRTLLQELLEPTADSEQ